MVRRLKILDLFSSEIDHKRINEPPPPKKKNMRSRPKLKEDRPSSQSLEMIIFIQYIRTTSCECDVNERQMKL
jgi:hypothetical protein